MTGVEPLKVAIVDYGLGNLFSVMHACGYAGLRGFITSNKKEILEAEAVILPGVGAFGDAMEALKKLDLIAPIRDVASSGKILVGICLGMQLLMTESYEFGKHQGLGIVRGPVIRFDNPRDSSGRILKVPQVGWNAIHQATGSNPQQNSWTDSPLMGLRSGEYMYFVHSYYLTPENPRVFLSTTRYGHIEFCSSLRYGNVFAFQFHPERSGSRGLKIYQNLSNIIWGKKKIRIE